MIKKVVLQNYRCFQRSEIRFRTTSIIVGNNNAGKSTLIEALRIVATVAGKFKHTNYIAPPPDFNLPAIKKGIKVNTDDLKVDLRTIVYNYNDRVGDFAKITAFFEHKIVIHIYLSVDNVFSTIEVDGKLIKSKADALKVPDLQLYIMPQLSLIQEDERKLDPERVRSHMATRLSSRHFRNQLLLYKNNHFDEFQRIAHESWPGLRIQDLTHDYDDQKITLLVYDAGFSAEIGAMGSGLQMWLQIIWFISRCPEECTIVLDEPDVYMHPDLQKRLFKIVEKKYKQIIIATHSVEIISAVQPNQIVTIDKTSREMKYADSLSAVQTIINNMGSEQNLSLIRLGAAHKCVFVEGKDLKTLSRLQDIIQPQSRVSLDQLPFVELGGWSRFDEALGAARLFYDETNGAVQVYCILDRDFHLKEDIDELYRKADDNHLKLFVWNKKEIENYIINPRTLFRLSKLSESEYPIFCAKLFEQLEQMKIQTRSAFINEYFQKNRHKDLGTTVSSAEQELEMHWDTLEKRLSVVNGKDLLSLVIKWFKNEFNINITRSAIIAELKPEEISSDIREVIETLLA